MIHANFVCVDNVVAFGIDTCLSRGFWIVLSDKDSVCEDCIVVWTSVDGESRTGGEFPDRNPSRRVVDIVDRGDCVE